MGKKHRRQPSAADILDAVAAEVDRRMEQVMGFNAAAFSESAAKFYDGQYSALRGLRDWLDGL